MVELLKVTVPLTEANADREHDVERVLVCDQGLDLIS